MTARTDPEAGFTLFEVMVVVAVLALAAALAYPTVRAGRAEAGARETARALASAMKDARTQAMRSSTQRTVTIDVAMRRFWIDGAAEAQAFGRALNLEVDTIASERQGEQLARVRFYGDGSSTGGEVRIGDGRRQAILRIDWLTGAATILEGRP
jgi:general secretion pathway protein H